MNRINIKEYLHTVNLMGNDIDVCADGVGEIAVVPPVKFTKAGLEHYKDILDNPNLYMDGDCICSDNNDDYDIIVEDGRSGAIEMAYFMFLDLAGYCPESDYKKYFEDGTEEEI